MSSPIWKRPSAYVVLCAAAVVSFFVARGDLRVDGDRSRQATAAAPPAEVVKNHLPAPKQGRDRVVLTGRVFDSLGHALADAEVAAGGFSARTAADGHFELSLAAGAFSDLLIKAKGHTTSQLRASLQAPGPLVIHLEPGAPWDAALAAMPAAPVLTGEGTVRDSDGEPVTGAFVTAAGSGLWSRTDDIGRYSLPLFGPNPTLLVHRPATDRLPAVAARSEPIELARSSGVVPLPELIATVGATIRGILRSANGSPVAGVPVAVEGEGAQHVCESGLDGVFECGGLVAGSYRVRPLAWEGALGVGQDVALAGEEATCELSVEAAGVRRVQVCEESGAAVGKAYVATFIAGRRRAVAQADADGWAEVATVTGPVQYEVRGEDAAEELAVQRLDGEPARLVVAAP